MDRTLLIVVIIIVVAVLSLPLVAQLAKDSKPEPAPIVETPKPKPVTPPVAKPKPAVTPQQLQQQLSQLPGNIKLPAGVQQAAPGQPQRVAAEVRGGPAPTLNVNNLTGTVWQFEGGSIELRRGGTAVARSPQLPPEMQAQGIPGNWSVNGQWLRLSAMGFIVEAQIVGNQIIGPNGPIRRLR